MFAQKGRHDLAHGGSPTWAAAILAENRVVLETLRDLLIGKKTIDAKALRKLLPAADPGRNGPAKKIESAPAPATG